VFRERCFAQIYGWHSGLLATIDRQRSADRRDFLYRQNGVAQY